MTQDIVLNNNGIITSAYQILEIHGASIDIKPNDFFGIIM